MARRRRHAMVRAVVVAAGVLLAAACGAAQEVGGSPQDLASDDATVAATPPPTATRSAPSSPSDDGTGVGELADTTDDDRPVERSLRPTIDEAVRDLADRIGVSPDRIRVVRAQRVTWPDDTLGCPLRGDERLGGPHPGTRVTLEVDGVLYRYHSGGPREEPFLCDPAAAKFEEHHARTEP